MNRNLHALKNCLVASGNVSGSNEESVYDRNLRMMMRQLFDCKLTSMCLTVNYLIYAVIYRII
jgi:hypothetical protein